MTAISENDAVAVQLVAHDLGVDVGVLVAVVGAVVVSVNEQKDDVELGSC